VQTESVSRASRQQVVVVNPLDTGEPFEIELCNPNPTSSKTKDGPKYRVSFEVHQDAWQEFMDANTNGMVLELTGRATVIPAPKIELPERPKGGPLSKASAMLCGDHLANEFAEINGYEDFKHMIYGFCKVESRAELDHSESAAQHWEMLKTRFIEAML